jgi:propanol-preferring alcohol dehydrogenase
VKAVKFLGNQKLEIIDMPRPVPSRGEALVKVMASSICRTDVELLYKKPEKTEKIPGHEVAGVIEEVNGIIKFKTGDRVFLNVHMTCKQCSFCIDGDWVFCRDLKCIGTDIDGGYAEYMVAPEGILRDLPDDISYERGSLIPDTLGTPFHAVKKARIKKNDKIGILGMGPLGLAAVLCTGETGADVIAIDPIKDRLVTALRFGADKILDPGDNDINEKIYEITGEKGLDVVIDCTGSAEAIITGLGLLKERGRFVFVGVCTDLKIDTFEHVISKELELMGSRNFNENELDGIIGLLRDNPIVDEMISHKFSFSQAEKAFKTAEKREGIKIILVP